MKSNDLFKEIICSLSQTLDHCLTTSLKYSKSGIGEDYVIYDKNRLVKREYNQIAINDVVSKHKPLGFKSATSY